MKNKQTKEAARAAISPELVAEARAGDQAAFAELYELTNVELYRTVRSMVRDEELAWDVLQDSYLRAWRGLDKLETNEAFLPWLRRIAVNVTATQMSRRLPMNFSELAGDEEESEPEIPDLRAESQPELALDRKESSRLVQEILAGLPEQQQMILGMHYYEDMPVKEIAETLQIAPGTVKAQLFKGRKKIEAGVRALEKQGVKLYGLSPLPFLLALLGKLEPAEAAGKKALTAVLSRAAESGARGAAAAGGAAGSAAAAGTAAAGSAAVNVTAMTAGQAFLHGIGAKLLAGGLAVALIGGGIWAGSKLLNRVGQNPGDVQPTQTQTVFTTDDTAPGDEPVSTAETGETSTEPVTTEPVVTEPVVTDPAELGVPADPETEAAVRALFAEPGSWYCRALTSRYDSPLQVNLGQLFYDGIPGADNTLTEEEREMLAEKIDPEEPLGLTCDRLSRDEVGEIVSRLFGVNLYALSSAQNSEEGLYSLLGDGYYWFWESAYYYHFHGDSNLRPIEIESVRQTEDGLICVNYRYTDDQPDEGPMTVLLLLRDGQYQILANQIAEDAAVLAGDPATVLKVDLQKLLSESWSWYSRALSSTFSQPEDVDLYEFFYDGIPGVEGPSDEELHSLYSEDAFDEDGSLMGPPTDRLPREELDKVLRQYFGLGLEETAGRGLNRLRYNAGTDCYYHCHGDTNQEFRQVWEARQLEDGTVLFTYGNGFWADLTDGNYPQLWTAALRPDGNGKYLVVSNLPGEWVTGDDLGPMRLLDPGTGPMRCETADADGTKTVRELTIGGNGDLRYREGDPDSEFSYWAWGHWWVEDDHTLRCALCETKEDGNRIGEWQSVSFACSFTGSELILVQESETGFAGDEPGTELRFPFYAK